ncbi:hypothetical protein PENSPDRAFT_663374 [Peniophora sp. CONT]|nr:hypothetical protein PENSPDRAFT_663374 [Peniophora sp. CONT]
MPTMSNATTIQLGEIADDVRTMADYRILPAFLESILYNVYIVWLELYRFLPSRLSFNGTVSASDAHQELVGNIDYAREIFRETIFILCDLVPLWRAYIIFGKPRWLKIANLSIIMLSSVLYVINVTFVYSINLQTPPDFVIRFTEVRNGDVALAVLMLSASLTAFAEVFATVLISWKVWVHRRQVKALIPEYRSSSNHRRLVAVLNIVIESGIIYSILWVLYTIMSIGVLGVGIYPTLVVVVISLRSSVLERSVSDASAVTGMPIHLEVNIGLGTQVETAHAEKRTPGPDLALRDTVV